MEYMLVALMLGYVYLTYTVLQLQKKVERLDIDIEQLYNNEITITLEKDE